MPCANDTLPCQCCFMSHRCHIIWHMTPSNFSSTPPLFVLFEMQSLRTLGCGIELHITSWLYHHLLFGGKSISTRFCSFRECFEHRICLGKKRRVPSTISKFNILLVPWWNLPLRLHFQVVMQHFPLWFFCLWYRPSKYE